MNSTVRPIRQRDRPQANPMDYVARTLFALPVVGGAVVAFLGAGLLESTGLPGPAVLAGGMVAFVVTALAADLAVGRLIRHRVEGPQ